MKKNKIILVILIISALFMGSCKKWIDPDLNIDPDNPVDVPMHLLLPAAQAALGYQLGGDLAYPAIVWMQHIAGVSRQMESYELYIMNASDINNVWRWGLYSDPLMNCQVLMKKAADANSPHWSAVAKILTALALGNMTDVWNDIPYSEAFKGTDNLKPAFDSQPTIYGTINSLLTAAISELRSTANEVALDADLIYNGDPNKWKRAAYALKARYALHLAKINGNQAYTDALVNLDSAFTSNADDLSMKFENTTLGAHPIFQFIQQRTDFRVGKHLVDLMVAVNDPRLPQYFDTVAGGTYIGSGPGELNGTASQVGPYYNAQNAPTHFITYMECMFIEAECKFKLNDPTGAANAYNDGVKASLAKYGVSDPAWEAIHANETSASINFNKIMQGKYTALFLQLEIYNDWRRTGIPTLTPSVGNYNNNKFPRRYIYPTDEINYNPNVPKPLPTINSRVWWDTP